MPNTLFKIFLAFQILGFMLALVIVNVLDISKQLSMGIGSWVTFAMMLLAFVVCEIVYKKWGV